MAKVNLRFKHYKSHSPVMELEVEPITTLGELRVQVQAHLKSIENCPMRIFSRWYTLIEVGNGKRKMKEIKKDKTRTVASLGLQDNSDVLLEGPLTNDLNGLGQALAMLAENQGPPELNDRIRMLEAQVKGVQSYLLPGLLVIAAIFLFMFTEIWSLTAQLRLLEPVLSRLEQKVAAQDDQIDLLKHLINTSDPATQAKTLLSRYPPSEPHTALTEALIMGSPVSVCVAIVHQSGIMKQLRADGNAPLNMAIAADRLDVARAFLRDGADANAISKDNTPPLFTAIYDDNLAAVRLLNEFKVNVNFQDAKGQTALHHAAWRSSNLIIFELIANNANPNIKDNAGNTPKIWYDGAHRHVNDLF